MTDPIAADAEAKSVHKATPAEHKRVVEVLVEAFYEDPFLGWVFPDRARRRDRLHGLFAFAGKNWWFDHDVTYTTEAGAGAAVWVPPGEWLVSIPEQLRSMPAFVRALGLKDMPRALRAFNKMESEHPHEPPSFYLPVIGVHPDWQGKGVGSALLKPMLERCDREGIPAYLEATSERNLACYQRHGFVARDEIRVGDSPPLVPMWREPAAS